MQYHFYFDRHIPKALSWITKNRSNNFFVFLHGYDVHDQYVPESGYDHRFVDLASKGRRFFADRGTGTKY